MPKIGQILSDILTNYEGNNWDFMVQVIFKIVKKCKLQSQFGSEKVDEILIQRMFDMENGRPPICQDAEARHLCMEYLTPILLKDPKLNLKCLKSISNILKKNNEWRTA